MDAITATGGGTLTDMVNDPMGPTHDITMERCSSTAKMSFPRTMRDLWLENINRDRPCTIDGVEYKKIEMSFSSN